MRDLEALVWRRFGHLRVYVRRGESNVGWYDVRSGEHELGAPEAADDFWDVVRDECERLGEALPRIEVAPLPHTGESQVSLEKEGDLAQNRPGEAAAAHAKALRRQKPVRSALELMVGAKTEARAFAVGASGERYLGKRLDKWARRGGWHVLHSVPVGTKGADIDHVLIGPFGVVTVNTKTTRGSVWVGGEGLVVNGADVPYVRNSRHEAQRTRELLAVACGRHVPVLSAIVFVGAEEFTVRGGGPKDVAVLSDAKALRKWLRRRGTVLPPDQVSRVYESARRPGTWRR
ncbi:nuclease-related domain-containing protein [Spirillospora sp. CA-294931]|uniref:nuclease-related domain-containing protein n=1 Tax=Spirillospora sp. CA-294931 TaxID=3240042 RepID=UPI003D8C9DFF